MTTMRFNDREFAVINERGIILARGAWDAVYKRWLELDKGLLIEIFETKGVDEEGYRLSKKKKG